MNHLNMGKMHVIHSFSSYLLKTHVPGTVPGTGESAGNRQKSLPPLIKDNQQGTGRDHRACERMTSVTKENKAG